MKTRSFLLAAGVSLAMALTFSCSSPDDDGGGGSGGGGGSSGSGGSTCSANFRTVTIGTQTWMAENLNCNVEGSKCYDNDPANCAKYGRLYDWATAMALPPDSLCNVRRCVSQIKTKHRGICPSGWHIPSDDEWDVLTDYVGGYAAGTKLKATSGWNDYQGASGNGTDEFGFTALPGGDGDSGGDFDGVGDYGVWWSATEHSATNAYSRDMYYHDVNVSSYGNGFKSNLYSVRCLQD